ncbi:MAG: GGDEF domain-containing protein [Candidatus Nanopelagicales bacterium]
MLDLRTLVLITTVSSAAFFFATIVLWRLQRHQRVLLDWMFVAGLLTASDLLLALRDVVPDLFSIVLGNALLVFGSGWLFVASRGLLAVDHDRFWRRVVPVEATLSAVCFAIFITNTQARVVLVSVLVSPPLFAATWLFLKHAVPGTRLVMRVSALVLFVGGLIFVGRGLIALTSTISIDFASSTQYLISFPFLYSNLFSIWFAMMLTMVVSMRIQEELTDARDEAQATNRELEVLAETDSLTQLSNRMRLDDALTYELRRGQRRRVPLSIIMLDIDHFKRVNDDYGHPVGDEVLTAIAQTLRVSLRSTDTIGRWGGEEFLVILPSTTTAQSLEVAEKIRAAVESRDFEVAGHLTVSLGVTSSVDGDSPGRIVNRADEALYQAKWGGRNKVVAG